MSMSELTPRQKQIYDLVREQGFLTVENLAQQFNVTPQTIRKEVNILSDHALIQRFHGGAGMPSSLENASYGTRKVLYLHEKR